MERRGPTSHTSEEGAVEKRLWGWGVPGTDLEQKEAGRHSGPWCREDPPVPPPPGTAETVPHKSRVS